MKQYIKRFERQRLRRQQISNECQAYLKRRKVDHYRSRFTAVRKQENLADGDIPDFSSIVHDESSDRTTTWVLNQVWEFDHPEMEHRISEFNSIRRGWGVEPLLNIVGNSSIRTCRYSGFLHVLGPWRVYILPVSGQVVFLHTPSGMVRYKARGKYTWYMKALLHLPYRQFSDEELADLKYLDAEVTDDDVREDQLYDDLPCEIDWHRDNMGSAMRKSDLDLSSRYDKIMDSRRLRRNRNRRIGRRAYSSSKKSQQESAELRIDGRKYIRNITVDDNTIVIRFKGNKTKVASSGFSSQSCTTTASSVDESRKRKKKPSSRHHRRTRTRISSSSRC